MIPTPDFKGLRAFLDQNKGTRRIKMPQLSRRRRTLSRRKLFKKFAHRKNLMMHLQKIVNLGLVTDL